MWWVISKKSALRGGMGLCVTGNGWPTGIVWLDAVGRLGSGSSGGGVEWQRAGWVQKVVAWSHMDGGVNMMVFNFTACLLGSGRFV